jgi:DNA invertase Pin-like site-specific DNA recombinase
MEGMNYGYARVSTDAQDHSSLLAQLKAAGCTRIFREKLAGATADRPQQLRKAINQLESGDLLMVTCLDRLARWTRDLLNTLDTVAEGRSRIPFAWRHTGGHDHGARALDLDGIRWS